MRIACGAQPITTIADSTTTLGSERENKASAKPQPRAWLRKKETRNEAANAPPCTAKKRRDEGHMVTTAEVCPLEPVARDSDRDFHRHAFADPGVTLDGAGLFFRAAKHYLSDLPVPISFREPRRRIGETSAVGVACPGLARRVRTARDPGRCRDCPLSPVTTRRDRVVGSDRGAADTLTDSTAPTGRRARGSRHVSLPSRRGLTAWSWRNVAGNGPGTDRGTGAVPTGGAAGCSGRGGDVPWAVAGFPGSGPRRGAAPAIGGYISVSAGFHPVRDPGDVAA